MKLEVNQDVRARAYRALGEPIRLAIVESLWAGDRTPSELRDLAGVGWNVLAFHLNVLHEAGLTDRVRSEGDGRRRYVVLRADLPVAVAPPPLALPSQRPRTLFVCTHNAARSQFAAALWRRATGLPAASAGSSPAHQVHPLAVEIAGAHGVDLSRARPRHLSSARSADLVVSVCDRARERGVPKAPAILHWSVPDPIRGTADDFERAFNDVARRVARLAVLAAAAPPPRHKESS